MYSSKGCIMSKADILLKKAALFEKLAQEVLPLTDLPTGEHLQEDPSGHAYYAAESDQPQQKGSIPPASMSGPSSVGGSKAKAAPPAPAKPAPPAPAKPKAPAPKPGLPKHFDPNWGARDVGGPSMKPQS